MKRLLSLIGLSLVASSCINRTNPLDVKGDAYVKPSFTVAGIPEDRVIRGDQLSLICTGNSSGNRFRFKIDEEPWTDWQNGSWEYSLSDRHHDLTIESIYSSAMDTARESIQFSSLSTDGTFYFSPATISLDNPTVTLSVLGLLDSVATLHFELTTGSITAASPAGDSSFVKTLFKDKTMDLSVLPGGTLITGSRDIATITLDGVIASDTIGYTVHCENTTGDTVVISGIIGTIVE